jgi:hypothetical protein
MLLNVHRGQRQNLGPLLLPQLCGDDTAHSRPNRLTGLVDQYTCIVVELDYTAIGPLPLFRCAHHDGVPYVASSDLVRCADGNGGGLRTEVALLLDDDYDAVT